MTGWLTVLRRSRLQGELITRNHLFTRHFATIDGNERDSCIWVIDNYDPLIGQRIAFVDEADGLDPYNPKCYMKELGKMVKHGLVEEGSDNPKGHLYLTVSEDRYVIHNSRYKFIQEGDTTYGKNSESSKV